MTNNLIPSAELAYLIGVRQTDATICNYRFRGVKRIRFVLTVGSKSLPMVEKTQEIFAKHFDRRVKIMAKHGKSLQGGGPLFCLEVNINTLWPIFKQLGIHYFRIPRWISRDEKFFGAYLAGLIDGDGDVTLKRPTYPQCRIRITSSDRLNEVIRLIKRYLRCACYSEYAIQRINSLPRARAKYGSYYKLSFLVSPKNKEFILSHVLPFITIIHKRQRIIQFLSAQQQIY